MDETDFRILAALYNNGRQSYSVLSRSVSLSIPSVRDRIEKLKDQGILSGFVLNLDPGIFGRTEVLLFFNGDWSRKDAEKILKVPGVVRVALKIGGGMSIQLWARDPQDEAIQIESTLGVSSSWRVSRDRKERGSVSLMEFQLIEALVNEPKRSLDNLIRVTGLSPKTIRKHLGSLTDREIISVRPKLGALTGSGELVFQLLVFGNVGMDEIRSIISDSVLIVNQPPAKYLLCRGSDLNDVTSKTGAIQRLPGVKSVEITLNRELLYNLDFIHKLVQEEIAKRMR